MKKLTIKVTENLGNEMDIMDMLTEFDSGYICDVIAEISDREIPIYYEDLDKVADKSDIEDAVIDAIDNGLYNVDTLNCYTDVKNCIKEGILYDDDILKEINDILEHYSDTLVFLKYDLLQSGIYNYIQTMLYDNLTAIIHNYIVDYTTKNNLIIHNEYMVLKYIDSIDNDYKLEDIIEFITKYSHKNKIIYVTFNDPFMSGWGQSQGLTNKLIFECDETTYQIVMQNAKNRNMKYVNYHYIKPSFVTKKDMAMLQEDGITKKNNYIQLKKHDNCNKWWYTQHNWKQDINGFYLEGER